MQFLTAADSLISFEILERFYFRTEAAAYEIYEINSIRNILDLQYPQKCLPTYQAPWCKYNHKVRDGFSLWIMHNLSLLIVFAFSVLPSRAITSSKK